MVQQTAFRVGAVRMVLLGRQQGVEVLPARHSYDQRVRGVQCMRNLLDRSLQLVSQHRLHQHIFLLRQVHRGYISASSEEVLSRAQGASVVSLRSARVVWGSRELEPCRENMGRKQRADKGWWMLGGGVHAPADAICPTVDYRERVHTRQSGRRYFMSEVRVGDECSARRARWRAAIDDRRAPAILNVESEVGEGGAR